MNLRDRIEILSITGTVDASGHLDEGITVLKETWADFVPMSERRALEQGQVLGNRPALIYLRVLSFPELNNDHFIRWRDNIYTIHSVKNLDARDVYFEVIAFEKG